MLSESIEDIISNIIDENPGVFAVYGVGSRDINSDYDITILVEDEGTLNKIYSFLKSGEVPNVLKKNNATIYVGLKDKYEGFQLESYFIGEDGVGSDYGYGFLAPTIRLSYTLNTMNKQLYFVKNKKEFEVFRNHLSSILENVKHVPVNEPYELFMTAKWGSFYDYMVSNDDSKLAKAILLTFYSLLSLDDGKFRNSYDEIAHDAHFINLGKLKYFNSKGFNQTNVKDLFVKLPSVKRGDTQLTDDEKFVLEHFFIKISGFMEDLSTYLNIDGDDLSKYRVRYFLENKISSHGGINEVITEVNKKLEDNNPAYMMVYLTDIFKFIDVNDEMHHTFLKNVDKVYSKLEWLVNNINLNSDYKIVDEFAIKHKVYHLKTKYLLGDLDVNELDEYIHALENFDDKKMSSIYLARGLSRSKQIKDFIVSELYFLRSTLVSNYDDSNMKEKMREALVLDPLNDDKISEYIKYIDRNYKYMSLNHLFTNPKFSGEFYSIIKDHLNYKIDSELGELKYMLLQKAKDLKESIHNSGGEQLSFVERTIVIPTIYTLGDLYKEYSGETGDFNKIRMKEFNYLDALAHSKYFNVGDRVRELLIDASESIFRLELPLVYLLSNEHDAFYITYSNLGSRVV